MTGEFPTQRANNAENVSIWWRHHALTVFMMKTCSAASNDKVSIVINLHLQLIATVYVAATTEWQSWHRDNSALAMPHSSIPHFMLRYMICVCTFPVKQRDQCGRMSSTTCTQPPYCKTSSIFRTWEGNKIVDHSDVVGASPVGAAPTTSSFAT